jgi:hypothetical protein
MLSSAFIDLTTQCMQTVRLLLALVVPLLGSFSSLVIELAEWKAGRGAS